MKNNGLQIGHLIAIHEEVDVVDFHVGVMKSRKELACDRRFANAGERDKRAVVVPRAVFVDHGNAAEAGIAIDDRLIDAKVIKVTG